jgi:hypothetical protein
MMENDTMQDNRNRQDTGMRDSASNKDQQAVDKAPGEERDKSEQLTTDDLKGKKVDADPQFEQPIRQLP